MRQKRHRTLTNPLILVFTLTACTTEPDTALREPPAMMLCSGAPTGCAPVPPSDAWPREPDRPAPFGPPAPLVLREPEPPPPAETWLDRNESWAEILGALLIVAIGKWASGGGGSTCHQSHAVTHTDPATHGTYQTTECIN